MVKSLDRALSILEYLTKRKSAGISELAVEFDMDKSSVSRIMHTFEKHGLVAKSEQNSKYYIASGVLQLSYNTLLKQNIIEIAKPYLTSLSDTLNTTARLCMVEGKKVFVIDQAIPHKGKDIKDADIPGINKPLYCSAIGKIILAYMAPEAQKRYFQKIELVPYTENTICDVDALKAELSLIRERGYALNLAEYSDRTYCIAFPVFGLDEDTLEYCVGITSWTDHRQNPDHFEWILQYMKKISDTITKDYRLFISRNNKNNMFSKFIGQ